MILLNQMIKYFKTIKENKLNRGMTYVELIVVLSIFSVLSSVVIFNYGSFQAKVDIKNLASDIALKIVEAQKASLSGVSPPLAQQALIQNRGTWKPAYGVYISNAVSDYGSFIYFTDLDDTVPPQNGKFDGSDCGGECLDKILITRGSTISTLRVFGAGSGCQATVTNFSISFKRPDSKAIITSSGLGVCDISYIQIDIITSKGPQGPVANIKVFPSGRIQVD